MNPSSILRPSLAAALLLVVLAACEETKTVAPDSAAPVEVAPAGPVDLLVGDTLRLRVTSPSPSVTFRSVQPDVASVTAGGLVTAHRAGSTAIVVVPDSDPSRQKEVQVRVSARPVATDTSRASVAITGVRDPATREGVNAAAVRGSVLLQLDFNPGRATRLEVLAGDSVRCVQTFGGPSASLAAGTAAVPAECVLNTAQFDSLSGRPAFANGPLTLSARLVGRQDSVLAASERVTLGLANPTSLLVRSTGARQAADAQGLLWIDGPLTVVAIPVIYDPGASVARARFRYEAPSGETLAAEDTDAPFTAVFRENTEVSAGGLLGINDPALRVSVETTLGSGAPGPQAISAPVRYDNEPPTPGGVVGRAWIGAQTAFAQLYNAGAERDRGVGRVTARFFVGEPTSEPAQIVAAGKEVRQASELAAAPVGTYRFAALVCDALANCQTVEGFSFGVDLVAPSITVVSLPDRVVNPDQSLAVTVDDDRSGFAGRYLEASVTRLDADPTTGECGPVVEGVDLPGRLVTGACAPDTVAALPLPQRAAGYYTYVLAPVDQAGNRGAPVVRSVLVDRTAPTITGVLVAAPLVSGRDASVGVAVEDNLDLLSVTALWVYRLPQGGQLALPFAGPDSAGTPFDSQLVTRHSATLTLPFISTLTFPESGRIAGAPTSVADSVRIRVRDVARNTTEESRPVSATGPATSPFASADSVDAVLSAQNVCTAGCLTGDPATATLSARVIGPAGFRNPFEGGRVYFFAQDASGAVTLLGSTSASSVSETGVQKVLTFSLPIRPAAGQQGELTVFAVGTNQSGNGLRIGSARLRLFVRSP